MQALNPYLPSYEYVPDGEPHIFNNRLYVYGSHDRFNGKDFCLNDYVCWSAPLDDLGNWKYEGIIYHRNDDPRNSNSKSVLNAPDVVQGPDGRYYLYYVLSMLTVVSVAVSDRPEGPFEFYGYVRNRDGSLYGENQGEVYNFDPGVFVDDDGKIYLYTGFSPDEGFLKKVMSYRKLNLDGAFGMELEPDMLTIKRKPELIVPGPLHARYNDYKEHPFYEASSMRKIRGKYYFIYSSLLSHELCYAIADSPLGQFRYGGILISNGDIGYHGNTKALNYTGNTHGSMVCIADQWYIFYHRQTNQQKCCRQGCAEKIYINEDGSIDQVEMTSCGLNDGPLKGSGYYEARIACNLSSQEGTFPYLKRHEKDKKNLHPYFTQSGTDRNDNPNQYIANMTDGSWAGFKYFELNRPEQVAVSVKGTGIGEFKVFSDINEECIGTVAVSPSDGWMVYTIDMIRNLEGKKALYFKYQGTGYIDFKGFEIIEKGEK